MVGEDDLADRLVAVDLGDDPGALVGVLLDLLPLGVGELAPPGLEDVVGEHELADVVQQPGRVDELLLLGREPRLDRDLARVAGDRGTVAGGHPVAQVQRSQQRGEQRDLEAGELAGPQLELVGALLGDQQGADQVLEDEHQDAEQDDGLGADLDVGEGDADREHRRGELGRQHGEQGAADLGREAGALLVAGVARDQREVDRQREHEDAADQEVEGGAPGRNRSGFRDGVKDDPGDQREPGVGDQVDQQVLGRIAGLEPADQDRDHAHQRRRAAAEEDGADHDRQEARRDDDLMDPGANRDQVADHRDRGQGAEQPEVPVGHRVAEDRDRQRRRQGDELGVDHGLGRAGGHQCGGRMAVVQPVSEFAFRP